MEKIIKVNWNSIKSVKQAERKKTSLENGGYVLIKTISGLNTMELTYKK